MKKLLLCFAAATALMANAQQFRVVSNQQLDLGQQSETFHPTFTPDGNSILLTSENYNGLGIYNFSTKKYTKLTDMATAGWEPAVSEDGKTIITRSSDFHNSTVTLYTLDVATKALKPFAVNINHVNAVSFSNGKVSYSVKGVLQTKQVSNSISNALSRDVFVATNEDLKLEIYRNGKATLFDPFGGDAQYVWASVSPNGQKILFVSHGIAYVCNLDGSNMVNLGNLSAPKWRGNTHVVAMTDEDDGYFYTESNIVIMKADGTGMQQLTNSNEISMFPSVSPDGSQIAYHTTDGKVYIMTIQEK